MPGLRVPSATYRLQFNHRVRFQDASALVPYLERLGVSDLYASPVSQARRGSLHGYDVVDPAALNPELGAAADFEVLTKELGQHGMGLLLDIVPNHMAAGAENRWWLDFLANGQCSRYAALFDVGFPAPDQANERVNIPVLSEPLKEALGSMRLAFCQDDGLFFDYKGQRLPLDISSYGLVLEQVESRLSGDAGARYAGVVKKLQGLPPANSEGAIACPEREEARADFLGMVRTPEGRAVVEAGIAGINGSRDKIALLLEQQAYRPVYWKEEQAGYRRFFNINDLVGVRVEDEEVFEATHTLILRLVHGGQVTGLRVDHVDGLFAPARYLRRLQERASGAGRVYLVVEKILAGSESLPADWPVSGTTGYDFLNVLNRLFVDDGGVRALEDICNRAGAPLPSFEDVVYQKKKQVMADLFHAEIDGLGRLLARLCGEVSPGALKAALVEVTACLPVYRTYTCDFETSSADRACLEHAFEEAGRRNPALDKTALSFVKSVLLLDFPPGLAGDGKRLWLLLVMRWQQITGGIMAKGFEDTALYNYSRLVSLNEVSGDPGAGGLSVEEFHQFNLERLRAWPHTMNATSTHDTKRSEDVRARINVLSELPGEWGQHLARWRECNQPKKRMVRGKPVPSADGEIFIYQNMLGAWPFGVEKIEQFKERFKAYLVKAAREAKSYTDWLSPDEEYEAALAGFAEAVMSDARFLAGFCPFQERIAWYGALNSLAQVLLKAASPGVPDFYQGTELWDLSLVDPDNRRPVDFASRVSILEGLIRQDVERGRAVLAAELIKVWRDGRIKLYITYKALSWRRSHPELFRDGDYLPLRIEGKNGGHVCAFARQQGEQWGLVAASRLVAGLVPGASLPVGGQVWGADRLLLPEGAPGDWLEIFTGERLRASGGSLQMSQVFRLLPVSLLAPWSER